jgi:hypothetical protein
MHTDMSFAGAYQKIDFSSVERAQHARAGQPKLGAAHPYGVTTNRTPRCQLSSENRRLAPLLALLVPLPDGHYVVLRGDYRM